MRTCGKIALTARLERNLMAYASAASAAGIGVMAFVLPANARVIYTPVRKHIGRNATIPLDLNNDGKSDFNLHQSFTCTSFCEYIEGALTAVPARSQNQILGHAGRYNPLASALAGGAHIGPNKHFFAGSKVIASGGYDAGTTSVGACFGDWVDVKRHYLGLTFVFKGNPHFGWARLNETCAQNGENTAVLTGYAYETQANKSIVAGDTGTESQPAPLGRLALGAAGKR